MSEEHHGKYDHEVPKHDPSEGYDSTEPDSKSITFFVIASVVTLVVMLFALQGYFDKVWNELVYDRVLTVPSGELAAQHNLENWRLTHYEYADPAKTTVRIPLEQAKELFLKEAAEGKTFYPGKPTEPKPEVPGGNEPEKAGAQGGQPAPGEKQAEAGKQAGGKQAETGKQAAGKQADTGKQSTSGKQAGGKQAEGKQPEAEEPLTGKKVSKE